MTESEDIRVTNRDVYDELREFRREFGTYVKEQGPKMALLEYKTAETEKRLDKIERDQEQAQLRLEERVHSDRQTKRLAVASVLGSSVVLEILNWILFHK